MLKCNISEFYIKGLIYLSDKLQTLNITLFNVALSYSTLYYTL